jgi:26S proteasome regulatory subunit N9
VISLQVKGDHAGYYRNALKYLGCVNIEKMSMEEKSNRAFCIAIAALVGDGVYNFGELLCQSVLEGLKYSENIWMIDLLQAFNEGDLSKFDLLRRYWERQADLLASKDKLTSKIRLLCLMELVFRRHAHQRTIGFDTIAEAARIDISEVEFLVMKGLSLGLVKGTIDEISQSVNMTWVQPRVLDMKQVKSVKCKVSEWVGQIKHTKILMEDSISDIVMTS